MRANTAIILQEIQLSSQLEFKFHLFPTHGIVNLAYSLHYFQATGLKSFALQIPFSAVYIGFCYILQHKTGGTFKNKPTFAEMGPKQ